MANKKWSFNPENGDTSVTCKSDKGVNNTVFYTEDINVEVVEDIVSKYNKGYTVTEINDFLAKDERVNDEEIASIIEQISEYLNRYEPDVIEDKPITEIDAALANTKITFTSTGKVVGIQPVETIQPKVEPTVEPVKTRAPRGSKQVNKVLTAAEVIKQLEDKIAVIRIVDTMTVIEIPSDVSKAARELLIDMREAQEELKNKFVELARNL